MYIPVEEKIIDDIEKRFVEHGSMAITQDEAIILFADMLGDKTEDPVYGTVYLDERTVTPHKIKKNYLGLKGRELENNYDYYTGE